MVTSRAAAPAPCGALDWERDGADWPNRRSSRFVEAGGLTWHVQVMGRGPPLLLVHGTGASTHSFRDLAPALAARFTVVAPDLPGHAFTSPLPPGSVSFDGMASALGELVQALGLNPQVAVGHSAGAALLARLALDGVIAPRLLVALNGAILPLPGVAGLVFAPMARALAVNGLAARLFAWRAADRRAVERLVGSTGSKIDERGVELYARLVRNPAHVAGVLGMMANWDLGALRDALPRVPCRLLLVVGSEDGTVSPREAERVRAILPDARIVRLEGLGHLAHEERPDEVARLIEREAAGAATKGGRE
ncbi:MAG: alpha/beta fold hydrolase [Steroidobacteraceae bacterium]|jgi:magnesium chelatase accessory protein|nr:alpha/beta fold hydrolase [Steroidobacteraceae bacterium]